MGTCVETAHLTLPSEFRRHYSAYLQVKDLIPLGGYQLGQDPELDRSVGLYPVLCEYVKQPQNASVNYHESLVELANIFKS